MKKLFTLACAGTLLWLGAIAQVQRQQPVNVIDVYTSATNPRPNTKPYTMPYKYQENRYLLFIFMGEFNKDQDYPTAITYNGKSASLLGLSAGSSAEATDAKTAVAIFGMTDAQLGPETVQGGTYPVNVTWNFPGPVANNQSYVLMAVAYRYVSQDDPGDFCINGNLGNDFDSLTCTTVTAGIGDLLWHASQFGRASGIDLSAGPVATNSCLTQFLNELLPTGNAANKAFIATAWDQQVCADAALNDGDPYPDSMTYTPTFYNIDGANPGRWVVASIRARYAPIYQNYSGQIWIDKDGDKLMEAAIEDLPPENTFVFVAVASNGPDAGKVVMVSPVDAEGHFAFKLLANQVEVGGLYVDPTYTLALVRVGSAPEQGGTYPTNPDNAMGVAPTSNTAYYVTSTGAAYIMGPNGVATQVTVSVPVEDKYYEIGIQSPPFSTEVNGGNGYKKDAGFIQMTSMGAGPLLGVDAENGQLQEGQPFEIRSLPQELSPDPMNPLILHLAYDLNGDGTLQANEIIDGSEDLPFLIPHYNQDSLYLKYVTGDGTFTGFFEYTAMDEAGATSPVPGQVNFSIILPATGITLSGNQQQGQVVLQWQLTGSEDNGQYRIERSINGKDFAPIGILNMAANQRQFTDALKGIQQAEAWYRIALVKTSGSTLFSNTWYTRLPGLNGMQIAPTVANNQAWIQLNSRFGQAVTIRILNSNGQAVMQWPAVLQAGSRTLAIEGLGRLPNGTYLVQVAGNETLLQGKIVVMH